MRFSFGAVADPAKLSRYFTTGGAKGRLAGHAQGAQGVLDDCMGWSQMLAALKAWRERGINLREGFYK